MQNIDTDIINRISEIKYDPNNVDEERFLLTMNDGNYVYLTLSHFDKINSYVDIIKNFENQKGILYLDSGEYFKVYDE
jgi:cell division septal protein FtsQ